MQRRDRRETQERKEHYHRGRTATPIKKTVLINKMLYVQQLRNTEGSLELDSVKGRQSQWAIKGKSTTK